MKNITYQGPHAAVVIPLPSGMTYECERDGQVEVPDDLAKELVARGDWKLAKSKTNKTPEKGKE